ncbi:MAG: type II secretion system F family protein [Coprococcus sp.]
MAIKRGEDNGENGKTWIEWLKGILLISVAGWLCFRSWKACLVGMILLPFYLKSIKKEKIRKKQVLLWGEFRDVMAMLYSSTAAGGTMEKALRDARQDMKASENRYQLLLPEFERMCLRLDRNIPMEEVLNDFAARSQDEDITYFVQLLSIAQKSGGSLADIIHHTADMMNMRMEINTEIETILAGKRGELKVMLIVPPAILLYMNLCSPDYMAVLYSTLAGRFVMVIALFAYGAAAVIGRKILDIRL